MRVYPVEVTTDPAARAPTPAIHARGEPVGGVNGASPRPRALGFRPVVDRVNLRIVAG